MDLACVRKPAKHEPTGKAAVSAELWLGMGSLVEANDAVSSKWSQLLVPALTFLDDDGRTGRVSQVRPFLHKLCLVRAFYQSNRRDAKHVSANYTFQLFL